MGRWGHIASNSEPPWKRPAAPPPIRPEFSRPGDNASEISKSKDVHQKARNSFIESAVGAFLGFDLLTKILQVLGLAGRFARQRRKQQQHQSPNHHSSTTTRVLPPIIPSGPTLGRPDSVASSTKNTPKSGVKKRPLVIPIGISALLLAGVGLFAFIGNKDSVKNSPAGALSSVPSSIANFPENAIPIRGNWDALSRSVVLIEAGGQCGWQGSGSIILDGSYVLTNQHVSGDGECDLTVWFTDSTDAQPSRAFSADVVVADKRLDLAIIRILDKFGDPYIDSGRMPLKIQTATPNLGEKMYVLGYPGLGGSTITLTSGDFAGVNLSEETKYFKTTASMNPGVSGGAALNEKGELIGIPTAGVGADVVCDDVDDCVANGSTIGLLRPSSYAKEIIDQIQK